MGQEIAARAFTARDVAAFSARLTAETDLLRDWFDEGRFERAEPTVGFELEVWLVDQGMQPTPIVDALLGRLGDALVVPELAAFTAEINGTALALRGDCFSRLAGELERTLAHCREVAHGLQAHLVTIGILPTVMPGDLGLAAMTPRARYRALNDQILALRHDRPLRLVIEGRDRLELEWHDVMLEAAATSFQIHLKVSAAQSARVYNASKIISGPLVAICANSPFLFGKCLWEETRIPLFEQAVSVGGPILEERVNFGFRYAERSVMETFRANLERYPIVLPQIMDQDLTELAHLRLHNGTIWRWNRPLIGFDAPGQPHLRIEHRVIPAGPTVSDMIANAALYLGAVMDLATTPDPPESQIPFLQTRTAFYTCAREGLGAEIQWIDGDIRPVTRVLRDDLVPRARRGLAAQGVDAGEIEHWLRIIEQRLVTGRTGAQWQRDWVERHGTDLRELTAAYLARQESGRPVHTWGLGSLSD